MLKRSPVAQLWVGVSRSTRAWLISGQAPLPVVLSASLSSSAVLVQRAASCPSPHHSRPGFCRACWATPGPLMGRTFSVRDGPGALKDLSVLLLSQKLHHHPLQGLEVGMSGLRQCYQLVSPKTQVNLGGQIHGSPGSINCACAGHYDQCSVCFAHCKVLLTPSCVMGATLIGVAYLQLCPATRLCCECLEGRDWVNPGHLCTSRPDAGQVASNLGRNEQTSRPRNSVRAAYCLKPPRTERESAAWPRACALTHHSLPWRGRRIFSASVSQQLMQLVEVKLHRWSGAPSSPEGVGPKGKGGGG